MRHASRAALPLVAALLLAGCGGGSATGSDDEAWFARPAPAHTPVPVEGVAACDRVPQQDPSAAGPDRVEVGERLPALSLPCLTPGAGVDLAAIGGRPVLVSLWASWCGPCVREMPLLQRAYAEHGGEVEFVGVDTEDRPDAAAAFLATAGVTYPQLVDLDGALLRSVGVPGLPVTLLLNADGRVAARHVGELDEQTLAGLLERVAPAAR